MRSKGARGRAVARALGLVVFGASAAVACVDGVTPDCSDPKIACGAIALGARPDADAGQLLPDAAVPFDAADAADASDAASDVDGGG